MTPCCDVCKRESIAVSGVGGPTSRYLVIVDNEVGLSQHVLNPGTNCIRLQMLVCTGSAVFYWRVLRALVAGSLTRSQA